MSEETQAGELVSMKNLLEAGVHFGHQKSHWNPRMKSYIFGIRNGIHIIDLQQTVGLFKRANEFVKNIVSDGGDVLFVGTKKQAQGIISEEAIRCEMPYINSRWLGGTLTNFHTIRSRVDYLLELKKLEEEGQMELLPKKEVKGLKREISVDIGKFRDRCFINGLGIGLDGAVAKRFKKLKIFGGFAGYMIGAVIEAFKFKGFNAKISSNGEIYENSFILLGASNGPTQGGNTACPGSKHERQSAGYSLN